MTNPCLRNRAFVSSSPPGVNVHFVIASSSPPTHLVFCASAFAGRSHTQKTPLVSPVARKFPSIEIAQHDTHDACSLKTVLETKTVSKFASGLTETEPPSFGTRFLLSKRQTPTVVSSDAVHNVCVVCAPVPVGLFSRKPSTHAAATTRSECPRKTLGVPRWLFCF